MIITSYGHALFTVETAGGFTMATDPYNESVGYPLPKLSCDWVTVSHHHHDHDNVALFAETPYVIEGAGAVSPVEGVTVFGFPSFHDDAQGQKRGNNTMFLTEADGLRVLHMGDLGHLLTEEEVNRFGRVDVLMIPVGGFYTIGAAEAVRLYHMIRPRIVIPMHYKTKWSAGMPIAPVEDFIHEIGMAPSRQNLLRITKEDIGEAPRLVVLTPQVTE